MFCTLSVSLLSLSCQSCNVIVEVLLTEQLGWYREGILCYSGGPMKICYNQAENTALLLQE